MTIECQCRGCGKPMRLEAAAECSSEMLRVFVLFVRCDRCVKPLARPEDGRADNVVSLHETAQSAAVASINSMPRKESFAGPNGCG